MDVDLVVDILRAMGVHESETTIWREAAGRALGHVDPADVAAVSDELPRSVAEFTGHHIELGVLISAPDDAVTIIEGMPGVGKTQLALRAAQTLAGRTRPAFLVDLRGFHPDRRQAPPTPAAVLDGLLRLVGVPRDQIPDCTVRKGRLLRQRRPGSLVVLDDACGAAQVQPILEALRGCRVLVTSRVGLPQLTSVTRVRLTGLTPLQSLDVLRAIVGRDRIDAEPAAALEIAQAAGHLPLALAVTARRIATRPDWSLCEHLEVVLQRIRSHLLDDPVRVSLDLSYRVLSEGQQHLLRLLTVHRGDEFPLEVAAVVAGDRPDDVRSSLDELVRHHLVQENRPGWFALPVLVRLHAAALSIEEDRPLERGAAAIRLERSLAQTPC